MPLKKFKWLEIRCNLFVDGKFKSLQINNLLLTQKRPESKLKLIAAIKASHKAEFPDKKLRYIWTEKLTNSGTLIVKPEAFKIKLENKKKSFSKSKKEK